MNSELYEKYRSPFTRFMRHPDLMSLLAGFADDFETTVAGFSSEGREIYSVRVGCGPVKVLAWSQMHGDESTATGALLDIFNFLRASNDGFDKERTDILNGLTMYFVPMLNPDGAEKRTRNNASDIDLNRDALEQISPEARILQSLFDRIGPDCAFNLHDQESHYAAEDFTPATVSLLAPPDSPQPSETGNRAKAMKMVCFMNNLLQKHIPGGVGKWDDDYEPRAFGEHFQKSGAATVLIESGGYFNDPERNIARKLNFICLLRIFLALVRNELDAVSTDGYRNIPLNKKAALFDVILRNARIRRDGIEIGCDFGLRKTEKFDANNVLETTYTVESTGDLSRFVGYEEYRLD